jgi:hypothetical protein
MTAIESGSLKPTQALSTVATFAYRGSCSLTSEIVKVRLLVEFIEDSTGPVLDLVRS